MLGDEGGDAPYETKCTFGMAQWRVGRDEMDEKDDAPMPTGWRSTYLVVTWESGSEREEGKELKKDLTSKEVPKMLNLTKDMVKGRGK